VAWSLIELIEKAEEPWQENIAQVQPAIFALQVALFELWRSWGIRPHAVAGHSMGEVAAAYVAGVISLEHAAQIIVRRSALLESTRGQGATLLIDLPQTEVELAIAGEKALSVAACNGPRSTVVAGAPAAVSALVDRLQQQSVFCKRLRVDVAAHSPQIEPLAPAMSSGFKDIIARAGEIPFYSSVHGRLWAGTQCGPGYWAENMRRPVQFWKTLQSLASAGHGLFVEIGPHPVLTISIADGLKVLGSDGDVRPSMRRGDSERRSMLETLGALYEQSQSVTWEALFPNGGQCVSLPTYPWQRERYWVDPPPSSVSIVPEARFVRPGAHRALGPHRQLSSPPGTFLWEFEPTTDAWSYLADHRVQGMVVVPGAAFAELALAGIAAVRKDRRYSVVEKLELQHMLIVREDSKKLAQLVIRQNGPASAEFQIASRSADQTDEWTVHARGILLADADVAIPASVAARQEFEQRCGERLSPASYYDALAAAGLEYGPFFRAISDICRSDGEALAALDVPPAMLAAPDEYPLHPALLDSCFQVFAAALPREISQNDGLYLPVSIGRIGHYGWGAAGPLRVYARVTSSINPSARKIEGDLQLLDANDRVIVDIRQFAVQRLAVADAGTSSGWLYQTAWRRLDRSEATPAKVGTTLILTSSQGATDWSANLQETLRRQGQTCLTGPPAMLPELLRSAPRGPAVSRVLYVAQSVSPDSDPGASALQHSIALLHVVQTLLQAGFRDAPRLWLITRGAQAVAAGDSVEGLGGSALWGLAATLALEHPEFGCGRMDLSVAPGSDEVEQIVEEVCTDGREDQIALRPTGRYVARLVRYSEPPGEERPAHVPANEQNFRLEISSPGILDNLILRAASRRPPASGQIEIEVCAAGLNFLDVLTAMGLKPGDNAGPIMLGGECSGIVSAVGAGVDEFRVGDAVIAIAPRSFGRFVVTNAAFAVPKPDALTHEQAATIPVAFLTAYYALHELGSIKAGDRILIHSASGGTGLAAVQLAQRVGAEIFATAGTDEKREFLRSLGIAHTMDSRSLAFADQINEVTAGRGVDLILNSLTGEAIDKSLSVLAPEGRFLEIGKKDIYQDYRLGLLPFRKGLSYFAVDLAGLAQRRPATVTRLLRKLVRDFAEQRLTALPLRAIPIRDAVTAFHTMAQAKHTGKLVLTLSGAGETLIEPRADADVQIRKDGTYLITGGLGGVGLAIAEWLAEQGAGALVLAGRSRPGEAASLKIDKLRSHGAHVEWMQSDVSDLRAVSGILQYVKNHMPPLRGIVHAAAVLQDATMMRLNESWCCERVCSESSRRLESTFLDCRSPARFLCALLLGRFRAGVAGASELRGGECLHRWACPSSAIPWPGRAQYQLGALD
jgi:epothilone polyketide synthase D